MFGWFSAFTSDDQFDLKSEDCFQKRGGGINAGLVSGTRVATGMGWRQVEAIAEGDLVLTFDAGLQKITKVERVRLWGGEERCPARFWPLEVPVGALGNREVMHILPGQSIMLESDVAEDIYGDPFSLIPAAAVEGVRGIERVPPQSDVEVVLLYFAEEQVVFANNGALFLCPASRDLTDYAYDASGDTFYSILPMDEARFLAVRIEDEMSDACSYSPREVLAAAAVA